MDSKKIISIEGNIGVGKSTFISILKSKMDNCEIVYEPIDTWKKIVDSNGKNILQTFYEDIPRWAYSFQNIAYITRMKKIEDTIRSSSCEYIFLDRSLDTDANIFEKMLYDEGKINEIEHSMYILWYNFYYKYMRSQENQLYIYLKCSPEKCAERIKKRDRIEEKLVDLDYLKRLNKYHDEWLLNNKLLNVLVLDCDEDFEFDEHKQNIMIEQIQIKINEIYNLKKSKIIIDSEPKIIKNNLIEIENL